MNAYDKKTKKPFTKLENKNNVVFIQLLLLINELAAIIVRFPSCIGWSQVGVSLVRLKSSIFYNLVSTRRLYKFVCPETYLPPPPPPTKKGREAGRKLK